MAEAVKEITIKKDRSYWIKLAFILAIEIFFRFIPPFGGITVLGMTIIGIFIGTIVGWCICDPVWPSLIAVVLLGLTDYGTITSVTASAVSNTTVLNLFFIMIFNGVVIDSGFAGWAGQWIISRKVLHGHPILLSVSIILAMYLLEPFASIAMLILLWDVAYSVSEQVGLEKDNMWPKIMVFGTLLVVAVGFYYNFQRTVLSMSGLAKACDSGFHVAGYPFIVYALVITILMVGLSLAAIFLIWKPDMSKLKNATVDAPSQMTGRQKVTFWMIIAYIVCQILPSTLPSAWGFTTWISRYGTLGTTIVFVLLFLLVKVNGEHVTTIKNATNKGVLWGPLYMTAVALVIATALTSDNTGVTVALTNMLTPIFSNLSPFAFGALVIVLAVILTNIMNNLVVAAVLVPIVFASAPIVGANPHAIMIVLMHACFLALLLPSSNPMTAFMFGSKDKIDSKTIMKFALVTIPISTAVLVFVALPLANLIY